MKRKFESIDYDEGMFSVKRKTFMGILYIISVIYCSFKTHLWRAQLTIK